MNLFQKMRGSEERSSLSFQQYLDQVMQFGGHAYGLGGVQQTLDGGNVDRVDGTFDGYVKQAYRDNGIVFACMLVRQMAFSSPRLAYQRLVKGRPGELFGDQSLSILERPWVGGTTQDLLSVMISDADLAGNAYITRIGNELVRLRPDHVDISLEPRMHRGGQVGWRKAGFLYFEGGDRQNDPVPFDVGEVCHFAPTVDPLHPWRGMSWLTPVLREIDGDHAMSRHKLKFFENGATPNMVIKHDPSKTVEQVREYAKAMNLGHQGVSNAYKTLHLGGGADVSVVGSSFEQINFKLTQAAGETRIAAAAGTPPVIVGLSEGLAAATYSNYGQARRRLADGTIHPLWGNATGSLAVIAPPPAGSRLWYDARDVPFLRDDSKDAAEIEQTKANTIRSLTDAGYTPDSAVAAVMAEDMSLLEHSGLYSVQLQEPGNNTPPEAG